MRRSRAERRHNNARKAIRKHRISRTYGLDKDWYDNLHQFSKNKIHCSCPLCAVKTRNKKRSRRKMWYPAVYWCLRDMKQIMKMDLDLDEYL